MPDCAEGATEVRVRRCIDGVWVEGWAAASEIGVNLMVSPGGCGGGCAKTEAIKTARERGWSADELVKVLKAVG